MARTYNHKVDGRCGRCGGGDFRKGAGCYTCRTARRVAKSRGISWEEAILAPKLKPGIKKGSPAWEQRGLSEDQRSPKQRYLQTPKGKAYSRRSNAKHRGRKLQASIMLDDEWNSFVIEEIYGMAVIRENETRIPWEVDHVIPLQGKEVCGFHVWYNLQLLPTILNRQKSNKV